MGMVSSVAIAAPRAHLQVDRPSRTIGVDWEAPPKPAAVSHVIYLNNCKPNGCQLKPGNDNATTNTSSIPNATRRSPPFTGTDATWNQSSHCVKADVRDFDVQIVTERPASGNYHMAIVAGSPRRTCSSATASLGVSPFSCGYIPNAISFTFANLVADQRQRALLDGRAGDRALVGPRPQVRQPRSDDVSVERPVDEALPERGRLVRRVQRAHLPVQLPDTGNAKMNSYAVIMQTFGPNTPDITRADGRRSRTRPRARRSPPGFPVHVDATDDRTVDKVEFQPRRHADQDARRRRRSTSTRRPTLGQGKHKVEVTAYDRAGNTTTASSTSRSARSARRTAMRRPTAGLPRRSLRRGPGHRGGLGTPCTGNSDCASNQCGDDGTNQYCVETCDPAASACPGGFSCLAIGAGGVCWPSNGDGGGCSTNGGSGAPFLLVFAVGAMLITRKRRR